MRKLISTCATMATALAVIAGPAAADERVDTPIGSVTAGGEDYVVVVDGLEGNPGPLKGFASVGTDGQVCADDNGGPDNGDGQPDSTSPTCLP